MKKNIQATRLVNTVYHCNNNNIVSVQLTITGKEKRCQVSLSLFFFSLLSPVSCLQICCLPSPSCPGVMATDCLISSVRIGDIRSNPLPTSTKSRQRGSARMKSSGTGQISQCEDTNQTQKIELLGANTFLWLLGTPPFNRWGSLRHFSLLDLNFVFLTLEVFFLM